MVAGHADGWTHFLPRLLSVAEGGVAGDEGWTPTARCQVAADLLRSMARYTVERPTQKRSASSAVLCSPV